MTTVGFRLRPKICLDFQNEDRDFVYNKEKQKAIKKGSTVT